MKKFLKRNWPLIVIATILLLSQWLGTGCATKHTKTTLDRPKPNIAVDVNIRSGHPSAQRIQFIVTRAAIFCNQIGQLLKSVIIDHDDKNSDTQVRYTCRRP